MLKFAGSNMAKYERFWRFSRNEKKVPATAGALSRCLAIALARYFSLDEMLSKVVFSLVPRPCTTVMIATEMPAAIRPYSMAVAPDSSLAKRLRVFMGRLLWIHTWLSEHFPPGLVVRPDAIVRQVNAHRLQQS